MYIDAYPLRVDSLEALLLKDKNQNVINFQTTTSNKQTHNFGLFEVFYPVFSYLYTINRMYLECSELGAKYCNYHRQIFCIERKKENIMKLTLIWVSNKNKNYIENMRKIY